MSSPTLNESTDEAAVAARCIGITQPATTKHQPCETAASETQLELSNFHVTEIDEGTLGHEQEALTMSTWRRLRRLPLAFQLRALLVTMTIICMLYSFMQDAVSDDRVFLRETNHPSDRMPGLLLHPEIHALPSRIYEPWNISVTNMRYSDVILPDSPCSKDLLLVTLVHSRPHFAHARQAIRDTWGQFSRNRQGQERKKRAQSMELYFVTGLSDDEDVNAALKNESAEYGDVIQFGFSDSYFNLTLKSLLDLRWASAFCQRATYVMKADDDVFVNVRSLMSFLRKWGVTQNAILGDLRHHAPVFRDHPKWGVPYHRFPDDVYPDYLKGAAYVMTADVPGRLAEIAPFANPIHIDDVYITGILTKIQGVRLVRANAFRTWESLSPSPCMLYVIKRVVMTGPSNPSGIKSEENQVFYDFMYSAFRWLHDPALKSKCAWQSPIWNILNWVL